MTYKDRVFSAIVSFTQVYSKYVNFNEKDRSKKNRMVFCPFHDDKNTPSMAIDITSGLFYCHACQAAGDLITFYMRKFGLEFKDALDRIGKDVGVERDEIDNHGGNGKDGEAKYGKSDFGDLIDGAGNWCFDSNNSNGPEHNSCSQGEKEESGGSEVCTEQGTADSGGSSEIQQGGSPGEKQSEPAKQEQPPEQPKVEKKKHPELTEEKLEQYHKNIPIGSLDYFNKRKISLDVVEKLKIGFNKGYFIWPVRKDGELYTYRFYKPATETEPKKISQIPKEELGYNPTWIFPEPDPNQDTIFLMEGEPDTLLALSMGLNACTSTSGAGNFNESTLYYFKDKTVYICYDVDEAGMKGAKKVADLISFHAKETRIVKLPLDIEKHPHGDFTDWIVKENKTKEDFLNLIKKAKIQPKDMPDKPDIATANADPMVTINEAWESIREHNNPEHLFYMGGVPVQVTKDEIGQVRVKNMDQYSVQFELSESANWVSYNKNNQRVLSRPPIAISRLMLEDNISKRLPILDRVVYSPVVAKNGAILTTPGYNKEARVYYIEDEDAEQIPPVPENPTPEQIAEARSIIMDDLLIDFPFVSDSDRANAMGLLILPFVREMIKDPTPNHLIEKPTPGTGASLLADIISIISQGKPALTMTEGHDDEEWRKRITSAMMEYPSIVLIDNISRKIDSASLSSAITRTSWEDRILGTSRNISIPIRCAWVMSGNNPVLSSEMARRTVSIRMDAKLPRPWQRETGQFKHPSLREWVRENRSKLILAVLTLAKKWIADGKPKPKTKLGGFEEWSNVVGGILMSVGVAEHLGNMESFYSRADTETDQWVEFISLWYDKFGTDLVKVAQLLGSIEELPFDLGSGDSSSKSSRLGKKIKKMVGRIFSVDGKTIMIDKSSEKYKNASQFCLVLSQKEYNQSNQKYTHPVESIEHSSTEKKEMQQIVADFGKNATKINGDIISNDNIIGEGGEGGEGLTPGYVLMNFKSCLKSTGAADPHHPNNPNQDISCPDEDGDSTLGDEEKPSPPSPLSPLIDSLREKLLHLRTLANGNEEVKNYLQMAEDRLNQGSTLFVESYLEKAKSLMKVNN